MIGKRYRGTDESGQVVHGKLIRVVGVETWKFDRQGRKIVVQSDLTYILLDRRGKTHRCKQATCIRVKIV